MLNLEDQCCLFSKDTMSLIRRGLQSWEQYVTLDLTRVR